LPTSHETGAFLRIFSAGSLALQFDLRMTRRKVYFLSTASTISALCGTLLIVSGLSSIRDLDSYALIQTVAMLSAFWVTTYLDSNTYIIKQYSEQSISERIPILYYVFAVMGGASLYLINVFNGYMWPIYIIYVTIYPLIFYKNEYLVISLLAENNINPVYVSRIVKQLFPAILAISTGSVAWTLGGFLLGLLASSAYMKFYLVRKITWIYTDFYSYNKLLYEWKRCQAGLLIAGGLAAMWYFERFSLSSIGLGLVSIAFFSLQVTNTVATLFAGTLATLEFNNSENFLKKLKKMWLVIISSNLFLMGVVYFSIKMISIILESFILTNEILKIVRSNINFLAIYSMAAIPTTTALLIGRMYVASGGFDLMINFYKISLPVHFGFICMGLIIQSAELVAMHLFMGNLLFCALALSNDKIKKI
jgi:hypothetical protein